MPILASIGILVLALAGMVVIFGQSAVRAAADQLRLVAGALQVQGGSAAISWRLVERLSQDPPLLSEELEQIKAAPLLVDHKLITLEALEDEGGKLNLNHAPYALPFVLGQVLQQSRAKELVKRHGEGLGLTIGHTAGRTAGIISVPPRTYYWRPDAAFPNASATPALKMESIGDLVNLWGEAFSWEETQEVRDLFAQLSTTEELGLNVNTASKIMLQAVLDWHNEVSLSPPNLAATLQLSDWTPPPFPFPELGPPTPRFRGNQSTIFNPKPRSAAFVRGLKTKPNGLGRPYYPRELLQPLGSYAHDTGSSRFGGALRELRPGEPVLFNLPASSDWLHAIWFHLQGPGPYTAYSNHYSVTYSITGWFGSIKRIRALLYITPAGVAMREWMELD